MSWARCEPGTSWVTRTSLTMVRRCTPAPVDVQYEPADYGQDGHGHPGQLTAAEAGESPEAERPDHQDVAEQEEAEKVSASVGDAPGICSR